MVAPLQANKDWRGQNLNGMAGKLRTKLGALNHPPISLQQTIHQTKGGLGTNWARHHAGGKQDQRSANGRIDRRTKMKRMVVGRKDRWTEAKSVTQAYLCTRGLLLHAGLPDGLFSNQRSQFG
jgi:hypothetical protein